MSNLCQINSLVQLDGKETFHITLAYLLNTVGLNYMRIRHYNIEDLTGE